MKTKKKDSVIFAVDFDGTSVTHAYPRVGEDIGAVPVLKKLVEAGHRLMLWTMRSGPTLDDAVEWFRKNDIPLWGINENPDQKASGWSTSHKQHANIFIDDAALGAPVKADLTISNAPFIDWDFVDKYFINLGFYKQ